MTFSFLPKKIRFWVPYGNEGQSVYQLPRAAIANYCELRGVKQQTSVLSQLWRAEVWNQGVSSTVLPPKALGKNPFRPVPASGGSGCFSWLCHTNPYLCLHMVLFFTWLTSLLSFIRTFAIGSRAHPGILGWSHLKILYLIMSAKTLFPYKVTFTVSRG